MVPSSTGGSPEDRSYAEAAAPRAAPVFIAMIVVGIATPLLAMAVSVPIQETAAYAHLSVVAELASGVEVGIEPPAWPDDRAVPPGLPLSGPYVLGLLLLLGGVAGLLVTRFVEHVVVQAAMAGAVFVVAVVLASGLGTPPDVLSMVLAIPIFSLWTLITGVPLALVVWRAQTRPGR